MCPSSTVGLRVTECAAPSSTNAELKDKELQALLRARLEEGWSPEQIKGRESLEVSVNTIYRAVKFGRLSFEARKHLRRRGKPYKRKARQDGRGHIKDAVSIEFRPKEVEQRLDIGNSSRWKSVV